MYTKVMCALKSKVFTPSDVRLLLSIVSVVIIILGSPSDGGGLGG